QRLAPLSGLALAEELARLRRTLAKSVLLLLSAQHLEGREADGLLQPRSGRAEAEESGDAAEGLERRLQHVLIAEHMDAGIGRAGPAHDVLGPGAHVLVDVPVVVAGMGALPVHDLDRLVDVDAE